MSVKQVNLGNLRRFSSKAVQKNSSFCAKEYEFSLLRIPQNVKTKNYEQLVFEQAKDPIIQWLSCIIIQKQIILLKVNIEVKCV